MSVNYRRARPVLEAAAKKVSRRHNRRLDEVLSDANLIYAECLREFVPGRTTFLRFLRMRLRRLSDESKYAARRDKVIHRAAMPTDVACDERHWTDGLSPDADEMIRWAVRRPELKPKDAKRAAFAWLSEIGWSAAKILETFNEIKEAMR